MESGNRIGSLRKTRWGHISKTKLSEWKTSRSCVLWKYLQKTPRQDGGIGYPHRSHATWKTEETDSPQEQTRPSLQESKHWHSTQRLNLERWSSEDIGRIRTCNLGGRRFQLPEENRHHIREEPDLVFIPTHLDHHCTGKRSSPGDRMQQLRHLNPARPGALISLRRKESD